MDFWSTYQQWEMGKAEAEIQQHTKQVGTQEQRASREQAPQIVPPTFTQLLVGRMSGEARKVLPAHRTDHITR